jgi:hypothetical protein
VGNSWKICSKYGAFYDSLVLLMLVRPIVAGKQGAEGKELSFNRLSLGTLWTKVYVVWYRLTDVSEKRTISTFRFILISARRLIG